MKQHGSLLPVLQVRNPGMEGLSFLLWISRGWSHGVSFYLEALGEDRPFSSFRLSTGFVSRWLVRGPHSLAGCQQGPLSVKRQLHSFSCGTSIFRASKSPRGPSEGSLKSPISSFAMGQGKLPDFKGLPWLDEGHLVTFDGLKVNSWLPFAM